MICEIPLTRGQVALVDEFDFDRVRKFKWHARAYSNDKTRFKATRHGSKKLHPRPMIFMHRFILVAPSGALVDHIDGNGLNNTRANLRLYNGSQNNANRQKTFGKSKFKGPIWDRTRNGWIARIAKNRISVYLGRFKNEILAAYAYDDAAKVLFGEFAFLNFPNRPINLNSPAIERVVRRFGLWSELRRAGD